MRRFIHTHSSLAYRLVPTCGEEIATVVVVAYATATEDVLLSHCRKPKHIRYAELVRLGGVCVGGAILILDKCWSTF